MDLDALRRAFDRVAELAIEEDLRSPLNIRLVDADARCLVRIEMTWDQHGWHSCLESGDLKSRTGISFPWFIVAEDPSGRSAKFPIESNQIS
jgi:hypothetical protein